MEPNIFLNFDVVSLFTQVPLKETLELLEKYFPQYITNLLRHVLTTTNIMFQGEFYDQTDSVAMGSSLSPTIDNFYMELFEEIALESAPLKPLCFYRYVDDMCVIWPHGAETLPEFLNHLNRVHPNIKFTMEVEKKGTLPFLDILFSRKQNGTLGHMVY